MSLRGSKSQEKKFERLEQDSQLEILSPNFTETEVNEWTNQTMLIPHEPIRAGLRTLVEITKSEYYDIGNETRLKKRINAMFRWYNAHFYYFDHHHHDIETMLYFPWVISKTEELPQKLSNDHGELIAMLQNIKNAKNSFFRADGSLDADNFHTQLNALHVLCEVLHDDMIQHMNEEEETVPALLRAYDVKQHEDVAVVDKIVRSIGLSGNKIMLPWICDLMNQWAGPQRLKQFMTRVPMPIRFLKWLSWDSHYVRNNKNIIQKIKEL